MSSQFVELESRLRSEIGETRQSSFSIDAETSAIWIEMRPSPRPCFTVPMLLELIRIEDAVRRVCGRSAPSHSQALKFAVLKSSIAGVFNLGGDLELFSNAIDRGDADAMRDYGRLATTGCHGMVDGFGAGLVTVALVQGLALGGGFEVARCCDYVVAEEGASFQLPETKFSLFPANGAVSVMSRRLDRRLMSALYLDAKEIKAEDGLANGVVDIIAAKGSGEAAVGELLRGLLPKHGAVSAFFRGLNVADRVSLSSMMDETERWALSSMSLPEADRTTIRRLVNAQNRRFSRL